MNDLTIYWIDYSNDIFFKNKKEKQESMLSN